MVYIVERLDTVDENKDPLFNLVLQVVNYRTTHEGHRLFATQEWV